MGEFEPPKHLVVLQTQHWVLNHRVDSALPGYLMLGASAPTNDLSMLQPEALAELGTTLARAQKALNAVLESDPIRLKHILRF
jgi:diadenosine tetraphosphate (Ap4A) HIT family hydrolase